MPFRHLLFFTNEGVSPPVGVALQLQGVLQEQHDLQMQILVCYIFFLLSFKKG